MVRAMSRAPRLGKSVHLLFLCQALANTGTSLVVTTTALAAATIADDKALVTLPFALQYVATMLTSSGASYLMRRVGRRAGFMLSTLIIMAAGLLSAYALALGNFWLYCLGGAMIGSYNAFTMYYRFAAAEAVGEGQRSKAISYVMAGGALAAFCGPQLARLARDMLAPVLYAGSFVALAALGLLSLWLLSFLDIPNLSPVERRDSGRPLAVIARQPVFIVALLGATLGYGAMTTVMTSTPLAMSECGHSFGDTAFVIQWHVFGMFAPAFFMGHLINRFGVLRMMLLGTLLMLVAIGINLLGVQVVNFWLALLSLGLGWSALFIGSTTLLTYAYTPAERAKVQALNDTLVFAVVGIGSLSSGALQHLVGWQAVNIAVMPGLLVVACAVLLLRRVPRAQAA
jgi:MFS family permease